MTIEWLNNKWWLTVGDGYDSKVIYSESEAWDLIEKNNLVEINNDSEYKLYEKLD